MSFPNKMIILTFTELPKVVPEPGKIVQIPLFCTSCTACMMDYKGHFKVCVKHHRLNIIGVNEAEKVTKKETPSLPPEETVPSPLPSS